MNSAASSTSAAPRESAAGGQAHAADRLELMLTGLALALAAGAGISAGRDNTVASMVLVAIIVVMAMGLVALAQRRRTRSMGTAIGRLEALAAGDLSFAAAANSADSAPAAAVNASVAALSARLRDEVETLESAAKKLNLGWHSVYDVARTMLDMSETTVHDALLAADYADHVSEIIQHIASAMVQMNATVQQISGNVSEASSTANDGARQVGQASGTMTDLQLASEQVQDVVKLIAGIADQTRVLALNATVEAARAGDAGRGFAVVAESVKDLAKRSADSAARVTQTMLGIQGGSISAVTVMHDITAMIRQVSDNQTAIATAVEEQTATTAEVGESSSTVAAKAVELAETVQTLTDALRLTAYVGADAKVVAARLTDLEETISGITGNYAFTRDKTEKVELVLEKPPGVTVDGAVTTIQDYEVGTGINQVDYQGRWGHGEGNIEAAGSDSYCSMPGDTATLRFVGTRVRFYGVGAENHGLAELSVDGGPGVTIDEYAAKREPATMYWESPVMPRGEHVLRMTVTGRTNPKSRYYWATLDYVEVDD